MPAIHYVKRKCKVCGVEFIDTVVYDYIHDVVTSKPRHECRNCETWAGTELLAHHIMHNLEVQHG